MKTIIINILKNGYTTTKKYTVNDLARRFYPLQYIIKQDGALITCNNNRFWQPENNEKRIQLIYDLDRARLGDIMSDLFCVINRFENGDAYGIDRRTEETKQ